MTHQRSAQRTADPYRDTAVIDSRAPRTNQAVIGTLALVAFLAGVEWLVGLLALQLAVGLTLGRRFCLPCLLYFELIQPRWGEGRIEDSRPPRFANAVGLAFLGGATVAFALGIGALGWTLTLIVAALALLAAGSGVCVGCEVYLWLARVRGLRLERYRGAPYRVEPAEVGLHRDGIGLVAFSSPYCRSCQRWSAALADAGVPVSKVDVFDRPDLARRYGVSETPLVLAAVLPQGRVVEAYTGDPEPERIERLAELATAG